MDYRPIEPIDDLPPPTANGWGRMLPRPPQEPKPSAGEIVWRLLVKVWDSI